MREVREEEVTTRQLAIILGLTLFLFALADGLLRWKIRQEQELRIRPRTAPNYMWAAYVENQMKAITVYVLRDADGRKIYYYCPDGTGWRVCEARPE